MKDAYGALNSSGAEAFKSFLAWLRTGMLNIINKAEESFTMICYESLQNTFKLSLCLPKKYRLSPNYKDIYNKNNFSTNSDMTVLTKILVLLGPALC